MVSAEAVPFENILLTRWPADKLQGRGGGGACLAHEEARQRVHEVLQSPEWSGRWLGVLDDLPAPAELEEAGLGWMAGEFPWAHGRTIITTRAEEWVHDAEDWREVTEAERRLCDRCGQSSGAMRKCGQCRKVHYCSAACQKEAWTDHKRVCVAKPLNVADVVGLGVGSFGEDEACSWIKGKVKQWRDDAGVLDLVQHLECLPLAIGQVAAYARVHSTATAGEYLAALKRCEPRGAANKGELRVGGKVKVHSPKKAGEHNGKHGVLLGYDGEAGRWGVQLDGGGDVSVRVRAGNLTSLTGIEDKCPEGLYGVVRLSLSKVRESADGHGEAAGQAAVKMALMDAEGIPLELLSSTERQGVSLLTQHALVRVDGKGLGAMHALTQAAVREQLTGKAERLGLAAAGGEALAEKLGKFDNGKPATHFIGRRYGRHAMAAAGHAREWGLVPGHGDAERGGARGGAGKGVPELVQVPHYAATG